MSTAIGRLAAAIKTIDWRRRDVRDGLIIVALSCLVYAASSVFELPPKLLLVSQPTRGVDIGAIEFIHRKLVELRDSGCAVLLVSAELEEVTALADRLFVIYHGRLSGGVEPARVTTEEIGLMMTGAQA